MSHLGSRSYLRIGDAIRGPSATQGRDMQGRPSPFRVLASLHGQDFVACPQHPARHSIGRVYNRSPMTSELRCPKHVARWSMARQTTTPLPEMRHAAAGLEASDAHPASQTPETNATAHQRGDCQAEAPTRPHVSRSSRLCRRDDDVGTVERSGIGRGRADTRETPDTC